MDIVAKIQSLPLKLKLLLGYLISFLLIIVIGNSILYFNVRKTIEDNIESELRNTTASILNMVQAAVNASITNRLRAVAEKNLEIVNSIYLLQQAGEMTREDAQALAAQIIGSQTIGKTGYIYCVDSRGVILVHRNKDLIGTNLSKNDFINEQKLRKNGYLQYDWANPGEKVARPKALYMSYFGPWDWIISASGYRDEFNTLVQASDLRRSILSIKFGETGYPYVMDSKGNLLIHPKLEGSNIYGAEDSNGHRFIQEVCERKNGSIIYPWQNPGEETPRLKLVFFNYIDELDWIIASSSYLEEFYEPLRTVTYLMVFSVVLMILITLPLTWLISSSVTRPLNELMSGLQSVGKGDFTTRLSHTGTDELGQLATYFNSTMDQLEESNSRLYDSETNLRSIFQNSMEGIFQCDSRGEILSANPSFAKMTGFDSVNAMLKANPNFQKFLMGDTQQWQSFIRKLHLEKGVKNFELQLSQQSGNVIWCLLNARAIDNPNNSEIIRIDGFLSDINDLKQAQKSQRAIQEELEKRVRDRTAELSGWVAQLKKQDAQNKLVHEMADMLQSCKTINETFPVLEHFLQALFPEDTCSLFLFDDSLQVLDRYVPAPTIEAPLTSILPDECWALRQGKPYKSDLSARTLTCDHLQDPDVGYLCVPLLAHGVTTGLLHLEHSIMGIHEEEKPEQSDNTLRLSVRIAEHLALALANLKLREKLEQQSLKDSLTGLSNRRHMETILKREFSRQKRHGVPFSILMIDVDYFKRFNDTYGHETGDEILKVLGDHLERHSRAEDLACRFGGEEFILILAETDLESAEQRAELLLRDVEKRIALNHKNEKLRITISIGVATCPNHGDTIETLLKAVDSALYTAKRNGRNRVVSAG